MLELVQLVMEYVALVSIIEKKPNKSLANIQSSTNLTLNFHLFLTVTVRCGAQSRENCTYFESTGSEIGQCSVKICRCDTNVCQVILSTPYFCVK